ncbi:MAG: dihydroneopterin aldolase [bacterium]|nr:dihydroneopterin aldolase [bacterium]
MDHIRFKDIIIYGYFGASETERQMGQRLLLDLDLRLDLSQVAASDNLEDTVSYVSVYELVQQIAGETSCRMLEYLAGRISAGLFGEFAMIEGVTVSLHKMNLPFPNNCREIEVVVSSERER